MKKESTDSDTARQPLSAECQSLNKIINLNIGRRDQQHRCPTRQERHRGRPQPYRRPTYQRAKPRQALTETDKALLQQRKIYKKNAINYYSVAYQCQMLQICLDHHWQPKGLLLQKKLMTIAPSTNIRETFAETLREATDCLLEELADHLRIVAEEAQSTALKAKQAMNVLTQKCTDMRTSSKKTPTGS